MCDWALSYTTWTLQQLMCITSTQLQTNSCPRYSRLSLQKLVLTVSSPRPNRKEQHFPRRRVSLSAAGRDANNQLLITLSQRKETGTKIARGKFYSLKPELFSMASLRQSIRGSGVSGRDCEELQSRRAAALSGQTSKNWKICIIGLSSQFSSTAFQV